MTKEQAMSLSRGTRLVHVSAKQASGSPMQCRVNGMCKTWKTRPNQFSLPVKQNLNDFGYITEQNAEYWEVA